MQILDFYKSVLTAMRYQYNDEGLISVGTPAGKSTPATVNGKRLVLPTKKFMRDGFGEDYQPFHPLSESIARRGTSPVIQHMQRNAKAQLAYTFHYLAEQLLKVAADTNLHKDLPPDCVEFLKKLSGATDKTVEAFDQVVKAATRKNKLITLYLKNGGKYDGKTVNRMTVIRFPIIEALDGDSDDVLGVEVRQKHRKVLSALFRLVVPYGDSPEEYSAGSTNRTAPYLHSFLLAYHKIASKFNSTINRYAKPLDLSIVPFELYSEKSVAGMVEMHDQLPVLSGNEGASTEVDDELDDQSATKVARSGSVDVYQSIDDRHQAAPVNKPAPVKLTVADDANTMTMEELRRAMQPAQQPQQQPMYNQGYNQQPSYYGQPQPQQQQYNPLNALNSMLGGGAPAPQQQANPYAAAVASAQPQQQHYGGAQAPMYSASHSLL